ncbi:Hrp-dependent type III effector protein [Pandoraea cepalis]|uniref:Hrp-dependent type III effector protein n=1 Tax=Pandoraea cepalis TaxID=2508294 RepID=A0AAW7MKQ2_9BURK|nr:four-carbon acid sugar kinase family protein [Pandoraea cepalis]MDN4573230.1 Hrp-dependent type III effector protein [Pandoraea cepalis]MDN4577523.1 Hrp-dependent type III effector protein [Pandoraea cepalis]
MSMLIVADDLSGAADCAIGFTNAGRRSVVSLDIEGFNATAQVVAIDIDTRRLSAHEAAARAVAAWQGLAAPDRRLYKKIDSTLRGNWVAEVAALQPLAGLAIVAPAFPATGRVVRDGEVFVRGVPLAETDTWRLEHDAQEARLAPMLAAVGVSAQIVSSDLLRKDFVAARAALTDVVAQARANGVMALIVDAQTDDDLVMLARASVGLTDIFWVGSGGLARALAEQSALFAPTDGTDDTSGKGGKGGMGDVRDNARATSDAGTTGPLLTLVGSLSAVSQQQCARLCAEHAVVEWIVPPAVLRAGASHPDSARWCAAIGDAIGQGSDLLVRIGRDDAFDPAEGAQLSASLAALIAPHFARLSGLVVTGGETARAMLSAVGIGALELLAEVEPGVAVGRPANGAPMRIVTKAGAFGGEAALHSAYRYLRTTPDLRERR